METQQAFNDSAYIKDDIVLEEHAYRTAQHHDQDASQPLLLEAADEIHGRRL
jgi:hypothetical protein